ncbi:uncharacterized protein VTP21DRAFT_6312 [Calcarisporiella thermophila]|uniref:uncharacterized protein n=1 Tax=Calcarisporiella thermophila TaxID=911321 RepID=UPI0037429A58
MLRIPLSHRMVARPSHRPITKAFSRRSSTHPMHQKSDPNGSPPTANTNASSTLISQHPRHVTANTPSSPAQPTSAGLSSTASNQAPFVRDTAWAAGVASASAFYLQGRQPSIVPEDTLYGSSAEAVSQGIFNQTNSSLQGKSTGEIFLSLLVYQLCAFNWLVETAPSLLHLSDRIGLNPVTHWFVRNTFFKQFCGGETASDCINTMERLKQSGIGSILDLSVEADIGGSSSVSKGDEDSRAKWNGHADRITELTLGCIQTASAQPNSFAAVKVTAMTSPQVLLNLSSVLASCKLSFFAQSDREGTIGQSEFSSLIPDKSLSEALFRHADKNGDGRVDWVDFTRTLSLDNSVAREYFKGRLDTADLDDYDRMVQRLTSLCELAKANNVRLMIDAEQTYFQDLIDHVAINLEQRYNCIGDPHGPTVFNTYQMYLREGLSKLKADYERSQRDGFIFGAKLVRGAYMVSERKRASELGLSDPIQPNLEATHASFNAGVDFLLNRIGEAHATSVTDSPAAFMVASHNASSVVRTTASMEHYGISPKSGIVMFGQLMGMCDQISYTLGQNGYSVYKYVPFGAIAEVMPYLVRRAQENASVMAGANAERKQLFTELKARLFKRPLSPTSSPAIL